MACRATYLGFGLVALPTGQVLSDEVQVFLVQLLFLVTLPAALLLLSALALFIVLAFFFIFILVDDEPFADL